MQMKFGRHAGVGQPARVGDVLVAEDVQVADVDVGVGKPGQVGRAGRRRVRRNVVTAGLSPSSAPQPVRLSS